MAGSVPTRISGSTFLWNTLLFTRALRSAGISTHLGAAIDFARALALVDVGDREQVRASGLALFVRRRDEVPVYDEVFRRFWDRHELAIASADLRLEVLLGPDQGEAGHERPRLAEEGDPAAGPDLPSLGLVVDEDLAAEADDAASDDREDGSDAAGAFEWSDRERVRHRPFVRLTPAEMRDAERLVDQVRPVLERRRTRRSEVHRTGRSVDARRMLRRNLQAGGDLVEWSWRRPASRPRDIILMCDISGSMERHARLLIRFAMALRRTSGVRAETFVFGTHLTRVTRELAGRDPDAGLARVSATVSDWSGGTRIGASLAQFNRDWARRVLRSSGIVIVVSDGWDRGDPALVAREMARLQRSCHRLIWLDPLAGTEGYQPLAGGMAAAWPFIDDLVAISDVASLERLGGLLASMAERRSSRPDRTGRPQLHRDRAVA